jgi:hypothetical protein
MDIMKSKARKTKTRISVAEDEVGGFDDSDNECLIAS